MQQCFVDAGPVFPLSDVSARFSDNFFYFGNGVGRARGHGRELTIQHRDIVVMIAGRENVLTRNLDQAGQLGERRAFVIIRMTKAEIDRVALVIEFGLRSAGLFNKLGHAVHLFLAARDQSFRSVPIVEQARLGAMGDKLDNLGQHR